MNLNGFGSFVSIVVLMYCVIFTFIINIFMFVGKSKLIYTGNTKHIVKTFEPNTFRVYSSVRTIKVK